MLFLNSRVVKIMMIDFTYLKKWFENVDYKTLFNTFVATSGAYILWILAHYMAAHVYARICTPISVFGIIASPFLIASPHCQGLRWVIFEAGNKMNVMFGLLTGWAAAKLKND